MTNQQSYDNATTNPEEAAITGNLALALEKETALVNVLEALVEIGFFKSGMIGYNPSRQIEVPVLPIYDSQNQVRGIGNLLN